jgi:nitrite reductase/ring-hydroxylating ferredoxin subunit|tara:strand:- start:2663 stop:3049 length:387 start_codon:yes stop_codon:yes gene_type:complete
LFLLAGCSAKRYYGANVSVNPLIMRYYSLEKLINLYDGYRKVFKIDDAQLMLLQLDGQHYLIESNCPHRAWPLDTSDIRGENLVCPKHHYRFDLRSGELLHATEEPCRGLRCYEVVYRDNELGVMLGD